MTVEWEKHDDTTYFINLAKALLVAVVFDRMGTPGWKVQVGKRSLKDKFATADDAKKIALAYAERILNQCREELETIKASEHPPKKA
ncbi:hypothetical protein [Desulfolutivibrio sp.]|uniref:hypothetical protein n=1 Tax=Desulfolutivibrio sp. TaxID=2773296 RepID=UPI002F96AA4D